jgi:uncharacterized protein YciI
MRRIAWNADDPRVPTTWLAGPLPAIDAHDPGPAGFSGSLIVAEFTSLAAAREWADDDPYLAAGVYRDVEVHPFRMVLP